MSKHAERLHRQEQREREQDREANERPLEPQTQMSTEPRSWASRCAGWSVGIHEQSPTSKQYGIYKCRWCGQVFDPPTEAEVKQRKQAAMETSHMGHLSRRGSW